jgi:hypothetical protein
MTLCVVWHMDSACVLVCGLGFGIYWMISSKASFRIRTLEHTPFTKIKIYLKNVKRHKTRVLVSNNRAFGMQVKREKPKQS